MGNTMQLVFPKNAGNEKSTVAEAILIVLSQEWPLTAKELHCRVKLHNDATFQATYKYTKKLAEQGVLARKHKGYLLNESWIDETIRFCTMMRESYQNNQ